MNSGKEYAVEQRMSSELSNLFLALEADLDVQPCRIGCKMHPKVRQCYLSIKNISNLCDLSGSVFK
jgi:hypothetical protein